MMPMPRAGDPIVPIPPAAKLSYDQSNMLMSDMSFKGRVKVACLTLAKYISGEDPNVGAHNTRVKWAQQCMMNPDMTAAATQPNTVMEDLVQANGSAITDDDLQTAVEVAISKLM